jgi:hypothetical protein
MRAVGTAALGLAALGAAALALMPRTGAAAVAAHDCGSVVMSTDAGRVEAKRIVGHRVRCRRAREVARDWARARPPAHWSCRAKGNAGPDRSQPIECRKHRKRVDFAAVRTGLRAARRTAAAGGT